MAVFSIQAPDGRVIDIEAPDEATALRGAQEFAAQNPKVGTPAPTAPTKPGYVEDIGKSLGIGAVKGMIGLADIPHWIDSGADWANRKLVDAGLSKRREQTEIVPPFAGSIQKKIEGVTGPFYQPQTVPGKYAQTTGEFASGLIGGGPAGFLTKVGARVVAPALVSEGAGQLTAGTAIEPIARLAGAVKGGVAGAVAERAATAGKTIAPTLQELRTQAGQAYKTAEQQGVVIAPQSFKAMTDDVLREVVREGVDPTLHPKVTAALGRLVNHGMDTGIPLERAETLRRIINTAAGSLEKDERRLARIMRDKFDDYIEGLKPADVLAGDARVATTALTEAREVWTRVRKAEVIESLIEKAQNRSSQFTGSGYENALRTEFRKLAQNEHAMRRFTPAEQQAIKSVHRGGPVENVLRALGRFAVRGPVSGGFSLGTAAMAGDPMIGVLLAGLGEAGRQGATGLTRAKALNVGEVMRGGTYQPPVDLDVLRAGLLSGLIAAQPRPQSQR